MCCLIHVCAAVLSARRTILHKSLQQGDQMKMYHLLIWNSSIYNSGGFNPNLQLEQAGWLFQYSLGVVWSPHEAWGHLPLNSGVGISCTDEAAWLCACLGTGVWPKGHIWAPPAYSECPAHQNALPILASFPLCRPKKPCASQTLCQFTQLPFWHCCIGAVHLVLVQTCFMACSQQCLAGANGLCWPKRGVRLPCGNGEVWRISIVLRMSCFVRENTVFIWMERQTVFRTQYSCSCSDFSDLYEFFL